MKCKLGDYIRIKHGFAFKGEYITAENNGVVLVTPGNFEIGGGFKEDKCKFFNGDYPKEYVLSPYDLIVTMTDLSKQGDTLGYSALVPKTNRVYLHNQRIGLVDVYNPKADKMFIYWLMRTQKYQKTIVATSSGSTVKHTSPSRIYDVEVDLPPIDVQKKIAAILSALDEKIAINRAINDNLEAQTQALFDELFLRDGMPDCTLSEIANVNPTRTLSKGCIAKCYDMSCLPTRGCVPEGGEMKAYNGGVRFQNGDTLIARITPCLENGKAAYINILNDKEVAFGSTEYIVFSSVDTMPSSFYYFLIRSKKFRAFALQYMNGSSGRQRVSGDELAAFPLTKPSQEALSRFDMVAKPVLEQFKVASLEINRLNALQQLIIASISSR